MMDNYEDEKRFYLKTNLDEKGADPVFVVKAKVGGKYEEVKRVNRVSGTLIKIEKSEYEYKSEKIPQIKLTLKDGEETMIISFGYNFISRSILNALCSIIDFGRISITLVKSKEYAQAYVNNNEETVRWKYSVDDIKSKVIEVGKLKDYSKLNEFFAEQIDVINSRLNIAEDLLKDVNISAKESAMGLADDFPEIDRSEIAPLEKSSGIDDLPF